MLKTVWGINGINILTVGCNVDFRKLAAITVTHSSRMLRHLLTYSMQQSPSWEANWFCS